MNNNQVEQIKYSIPKKGNVTKQNATDLYHVCKSLETFKSLKLSSDLIGSLLNNDIKKIDKINETVKEPTRMATDKQKKALNRIIYGRHYTVKTYLKLMECLTTLDILEYGNAESTQPTEKKKSVIDFGIDFDREFISKKNPDPDTTFIDMEIQNFEETEEITGESIEDTLNNYDEKEDTYSEEYTQLSMV